MKASSSGRARTRSGARTESVFDALHEAAALLGRAYIVKRPTSWKPIRASGVAMLCVPEKPSGVDYMGFLSDGRAMLIEAKRHTGGPFPLTRIERQQDDEMRGALVVSASVRRALVVEWFPTTKRDLEQVELPAGASVLCVLPWSRIEAIRATGGKSIAPEDLVVAIVRRNVDDYLRALMGC